MIRDNRKINIIVALLSYEAISLVAIDILRGEFLADLDELNPRPSLLLVMQRRGSRRLPPYRLHG